MTQPASACSPQRYLAGNRNQVRTATLTPSSVRAVENTVRAVPVARDGTAQASITGDYSGFEDHIYDVQITDSDVSTKIPSAPIFSGSGNGSIEDITSTGAPQDYTVELADLGIPLTAAASALDNVRIVARTAGAAGNAIHLIVDQTDLVFTPQPFSLLSDLKAGDGGGTGLVGPAYDWDTAVLGADNIIPASAHRISFGQDKSNIYLAYKQFSNNKWGYFFQPQLAHDVPGGTVINFVTGGRDVTVSAGVSPPEEFTDIVTVYDLLNALKTTSQLVTVDGVVANDRSPGGQAARELTLRTDAHTDLSYGSGGNYAVGMVDTFANDGAATELVTATCIAVSAKDNANAHLGAELWKVHASVSGDLGIATTAVPFVGPNWGFTIPRRLPDDYGTTKGTFGVTDITYVGRADGVEPPPICVVAMELGPDAVNQTIRLRYTKRPSGACLCDDMAVPNLRTACLGIIDDGGGSSVGYSTDGRARHKALYDFAKDLVAIVSSYKVGLDNTGIPQNLSQSLSTESFAASVSTINEATGGASASGSGDQSTDTGFIQQYLIPEGPVGSMYADVGLPADFQETLDYFETAIASIDVVTDLTLKGDGFTAWDDALAEWQADLSDTALTQNRITTMATKKYKLGAARAMAYAGVPLLGKTDASTVTSGDGCWRDYGDPFYWTVVGSDGGVYGWAFNNHPYYSARLASDKKTYFSTHEFAFQINVKCPSGLLDGDEIDLAIGNAGFGSTYQVGDVLTLPVIAGQAFYLVGGQDGTSTETWNVSGSVDGPLPSFVFNRGSASIYSGGGLEFEIIDGEIEFALGDAFTFSIEGAHFRWRVDGGAWSSPIVATTSPTALENGLSVSFTPGQSPSFVAGDTFTFKAKQPFAASNIQSPDAFPWKWDGSGASVVADLGATIDDMDMSALALHTLPEGATVTIEGGTSPGVYTWLETFIWNAGPMLLPFAAPRSARYLRLTVSDASDAGIAFWWTGVALQTQLSASFQMRRVYRVLRGDAGLNNRGRFTGKGVGGDIEWSTSDTGAMTEDDANEIIALCDFMKSNDDEPMIFVPQITRPDEVMFGQVNDDSIDLVDEFNYNRNAGLQRRISAKLTLQPVLQ